jgi:hypothetical protein
MQSQRNTILIRRGIPRGRKKCIKEQTRLFAAHAGNNIYRYDNNMLISRIAQRYCGTAPPRHLFKTISSFPKDLKTIKTAAKAIVIAASLFVFVIAVRRKTFCTH